MQYTTFVILNGPPQAGKTTIARELCSYLSEQNVSNISDSFAAPMKHFIATALGMQYASMPKDSPRAELAGYSVREFLIDLSESYIKDRYGPGIYGRWLYHRVGRMVHPPAFVICDDGGFEEEVAALGKRAYIVRVEREGKDFSGDSRSYLPTPQYTFTNNGDMARLWYKVSELGKALIAGRAA